MNYIYVGEIVNTHGIKGEVRVLSDFEYKKELWQVGRALYIGRKKEKVIMKSHRVHKDYDMLTFENITDINDVIIYKGEKVYASREDLKVDGYFKEDYIGMEVYVEDKCIGKISRIMKNKAHDIFVVEGTTRNLIPNVAQFVQKVSLEEKKIYINAVEGLLHENWYFNPFS